LVIAQAGNEVKIEATRGSERELTTYFFERAAPAAEGARVGRWSWDGLRLVTERTGDVQGQTVTAKQIYILGPGGTELTVETVVEVQHGYTLRGTKNYGTARDVYTRLKAQS
ncbi:MAG: hypothetical protein LC791_14300, partial [Acidobacteria bacterium]|nr:hypothetical protein [Acidobacteriota bacterium]